MKAPFMKRGACVCVYVCVSEYVIHQGSRHTSGKFARRQRGEKGRGSCIDITPPAPRRERQDRTNINVHSHTPHPHILDGTYEEEGEGQPQLHHAKGPENNRRTPATNRWGIAFPTSTRDADAGNRHPTYTCIYVNIYLYIILYIYIYIYVYICIYTYIILYFMCRCVYIYIALN